ncbi:MAG: 50S ribosomal protein L29 [Desulfobulbaceae bacterium]|nr:50S ribosomal protein L29 [Desulfobulbaceae bacterium]
MKINELRDLSDADLSSRSKELAEELFKIRFQHGIRPLENTAKIRLVRKEIARVNTLLSAKRKSVTGN